MATDEAAFGTAGAWIDGHAGAIAALSDRIWDLAEPGLCETESMAALCDLLDRHGFAIERGVAGMPTAFVATYGEGQPRLAVMCEYDATPGEAQRPSPFRDPDPARKAGFSDLHNGIGTASAAAAVAARQAMAAHGLPGSVVVLGTPAEKLCIAKPFMAKAGLLDGFDAIVAWHPRAYSTLEWDTGPGCYQAEIYDFFGRGVYGSTPWNGVSALDGVTLMNVIVQFLREHLPRDDKISINEIVTQGGEHPTALPNHAQVWYVHRALTRAGIERSADALTRAAAAAATALGARFERRIVAATRPWLPNHALAEACFRNLERAGPPRFPDEAKDFAREVVRNLGRPPLEPVLDETLTDLRAGVTAEFAGGADDVTEFCWHAPTARIYVAFGLATTGLPNWAHAAFTRTGVAHATVLSATRAIAFSVLDLMGDPDTLARAAEEHRRRLREAGDKVGDTGPLLPPDATPPVDLDSAPPYMRDHVLRRLMAGGGTGKAG